MNQNKDWDASKPYPVWPFGTVDPKELEKWRKQNVPKPVCEEAPF